MKNPTNEPVLEYKRGSKERVELEKVLDEMAKNPVDVPLVIGNEKITRGLERKQLMVYNIKEFPNSNFSF